MFPERRQSRSIPGAQQWENLLCGTADIGFAGMADIDCYTAGVVDAAEAGGRVMGSNGAGAGGSGGSDG